MLKNIPFYKLIVLLLFPGVVIAQSDYEQALAQYQRDYAAYQDALTSFYAGRDNFEAKYGDHAWYDVSEGDDPLAFHRAFSRQNLFIGYQKKWKQNFDQATNAGQPTLGLPREKYANFREDLRALKSLYGAVEDGAPTKPDESIYISNQRIGFIVPLVAILVVGLFIWGGNGQCEKTQGTRRKRAR